tara:strand:- start:9310 stop:9957 length:648 start_codon:yes stop_codon:yes gene_type:complete
MLPGIIAAVIADKLVSHDKWSSFKFGLYAFMLGVSSYALLQVITWFYNIVTYLWSCCLFNWDFSLQIHWSLLSTWTAAVSQTPSIVPLELILAIPFSFIVALIASWTINHKVFNKIARKLSISNKYGDENLYSYFLNAQGIDWVYIRDMEANLTYQGRVASYSETDTMQELVLSEVSVFSYQDSDHLYDVPSIYLIKEMGKFVIEVIPFNQLEEA